MSLLCLKKKKAIGQIINIGTGKPKKLKEVIQYIKIISKGGHPQFGKIKMRKEEMLKVYPTIKKAKKIINWKPQVSFNDGIKKMVEFYEKQ